MCVAAPSAMVLTSACCCPVVSLCATALAASHRKAAYLITVVGLSGRDIATMTKAQVQHAHMHCMRVSRS
jgi:hypothetical protein